MKNILIISLLVLLFTSCHSSKEKTSISTFEIDEVYQTERNEEDNIDSPAFWKGDSSSNWLISTAKSTNRLLVHNASTGKFIKYVGTKGSKPEQFLRPNGISVIDSFLFVVERDNKRIQVMKLPDFKFVTFIGKNDLIKPYGIYVHKFSGFYNLFVTDNYETEDEQIPANKYLGKRILNYQVSLDQNTLSSKLINKFGSTRGKGVLKVVESIYGDPINNNLLIAEEKRDETCVKVYSFTGEFKRSFGDKIFKHQVEGITLFKNGKGGGFWIVTDQDLTYNRFHIFDRVSFKHLGVINPKNTANTDGIWLTQQKFYGFPKGAFFAVNNDGNVSAFDLRTIVNLFLNR